MPTLLYVIFAAPFVLLVYVYLKAAVHVRRTQLHEAYPQFEPRSPAGLPPPVWEAYGRDVPRLEALGFTLSGYFYRRAFRRDETMEVDCYLALLRNEETGDLAGLFEILTRSAHADMHVSVREFGAEFAEGDSLTTVVTPHPRTFRHDPRHRSFRFPGVDDPRLLFAAHRRLLARHAPGRAAVLPSRGMEVAYLAHAETRALGRQAEFGYFDFDERENAFRPTWKGVLLMTARLMWPAYDLLRARERAHADATLKSLGLRA